ncbi:hypothetical protein AAFJ72_17080 [Brevibacillus gelatini]|uniref:hypothetical protein n=1 Tax=Brevibacillus gelatini TaxID=1655277 RepID=UPI001FE2B88B|nr:hypothetical protein [Brevibacillus gelatini]
MSFHRFIRSGDALGEALLDHGLAAPRQSTRRLQVPHAPLAGDGDEHRAGPGFSQGKPKVSRDRFVACHLVWLLRKREAKALTKRDSV